MFLSSVMGTTETLRVGAVRWVAWGKWSTGTQPSPNVIIANSRNRRILLQSRQLSLSNTIHPRLNHCTIPLPVDILRTWLIDCAAPSSDRIALRARACFPDLTILDIVQFKTSVLSPCNPARGSVIFMFYSLVSPIPQLPIPLHVPLIYMESRCFLSSVA